jgi:hypothetical protein
MNKVLGRKPERIIKKYGYIVRDFTGRPPDIEKVLAKRK